MKVVFVGGWATTVDQYPLLASSASFLVPFTGFSSSELPSYTEQGGDILVGWSTGAHMLLKECAHLFPLYRRVLLIAPFLSFTDSFPERLVRRMIAGMGRNPAEVVAGFHSNCGETLKLPYDEKQTPGLIEGLEYLISSSIEIDAEMQAENLILVHADNDRVVRRAAFEPVTKYAGRAEVRYIEGGHKIPEPELLRIIEGL